jgi:hypothetical protein
MRNANEVQEFIEKLMQARKTTAQANGVTKEAATPGKSASIPGVKDSFEPAGRGADVPDLKMPGT